MSAREIDWSQLPPELLHLIFKKLPDLPDLVRFRAICHRWRSAAILSDPPPLLPWFVKKHYNYSNPPALLSLYSMFYGEIKIKLPDCRRMEMKGANHRYMLYFNYEHLKYSLFNPLTRKEISLPFLDLSWCKLLCFQSDSTGAGDFVAIRGVIRYCYVLACCRIGDSKWMTVDQSNENSSCQATYFNGMFYVHDLETKVTQVIDPTTARVVHSIPPQEYKTTYPRCFHFFVESCGELLGITCVYGKGLFEDDLTKCSFEIHRLDNRNGKTQWVWMNSIGDRFLFLRDSVGVSYNASNFPGFQKNSIYFVGSRLQSANRFNVSSYLVLFDIESATTQTLNCPVDVVTWFLPGLY